MTLSPPPLINKLCHHDGRFREAVAAGWRCWLAAPVVFVALLSQHADAQEIPRPSYARQKQRTVLPTVSNFRIGEVLMRVDARLTTQFTDNVDLSSTPTADLIVNPEVGINATWAVTKLNTIRFRAAVGYAYYLNSDRLNRQTMTISPDSALSFDVYAGDVKINFHNQFSLQQEALSQGALSGVAQIERFSNTAGISVLWDTNDVIWNLGYDHYTFLTLGGANSSSGSVADTLGTLDHSTDQISASVAVKLSSALIGGIEGTAAYSDFPEQPDSNYSAISAGPYFEMQLTKYTHVFVSGGYKGYFSGANAVGSVSVTPSTAAQPSQGDPSGYYANLSFMHRLNRYYSDRLDFAHTDDVDALGGHTQTDSIRYAGSWRINRRLSMGVSLFYEDVTILAGSALGGSVASNYNRVGASVSTGFLLTEHTDLSLSYQFTKKEAERASESYSQNTVTISLGYRF